VKAEPGEDVRPLDPREVEAILDQFIGRDRIILLLAGRCGMRPQEIRSIPWKDLDDGTLTVSRARTKSTAARTRVIALDRATRQELKQSRLACGRPELDHPIIGASPRAG
jgi:integrase